MPKLQVLPADVQRRIRPASYLFFFAVIAAVVFLTHAPLFRLPFYWDELGQFIPASLDLFQHGAWVPFTTVPNVHPPGLMAYLAGFWFLAGYSVEATRFAMLLLATAGAFFTFLLAIELGKEVSGFPAFTALFLLCLSPLFVAQSMLAQLDMPAMLFTCVSLLLFLQNRMRSAALACAVLVMIKETGVIAPAAFALSLLYEKRWREALFFAGPMLPLGAWLVVLHQTTGHWAGNSAFEQYNAVYNLHPVRLGLAFLRRLYYLFIGSGHWIGTVAVVYVWKRTTLFRTRPWRVICIFAAGHVLLISLFGGAVLERYLMPLLPMLYIAFSVALAGCSPLWRMAGTLALFACLIAANFLNPLYPFPWENNLAFASFVSLQEKAADFVENSYPGATVATMFPVAGALRRPEFGYVAHPVRVREVADFSAKSLAGLAPDKPDALVVYSTTWDPLHLLDSSLFRSFLTRFYGYEPQATREQIIQTLGMRPVTRWESRGQWVEVFESSATHPRIITVSNPRIRQLARDPL